MPTLPQEIIDLILIHVGNIQLAFELERDFVISRLLERRNMRAEFSLHLAFQAWIVNLSGP